jgi:hypothetical protein
MMRATHERMVRNLDASERKSLIELLDQVGTEE